jgi:preprotein translocase subunit SecE
VGYGWQARKTAPGRSPERAASDEAGGWWQNLRSFFTEVRNEVRRVTWPSRREVYATTVVVILTSMFFGVYLWGLDLALSWLVGRIFGLLGAA